MCSEIKWMNKLQKLISKMTSAFWDVKRGFFLEKYSTNEILGNMVFTEEKEIVALNHILFVCSVLQIQTIIFVLLYVLFLDLKVGSECMVDFDCFKLNATTRFKSVYEYRSCFGNNQTLLQGEFFCYNLTLPAMEDILTGLGVTYGFIKTNLWLNRSILQFKLELTIFKDDWLGMSKEELNRIVNFTLNAIVVFIVLGVYLSMFLAFIFIPSLASDDTWIWFVRSSLNYSILYLIGNSIALTVLFKILFNFLLHDYAKNEKIKECIPVYKVTNDDDIENERDETSDRDKITQSPDQLTNINETPF